MPKTMRREKAAQASRETKRRDAVVNLRMPRFVRDMIDSAAAVLGKTRTDFIVESSRKQASDVLLDQRLFAMNSEQYDAFLAVLDQPPAPNAKLKRLLASKSPWET